MDDMEISVGAKLLLDLCGTESRRVSGELVGWRSTKTLLASLPLLVGIRDYLDVGRYITCRYMHEGTVYGFKSRILGYITNPDSLVFLSYPDYWESLDLRKQQRVPCFFPATFYLKNHEIHGILNDISEFGCRIQCGPSKENILENVILGFETVVRFFPFGTRPCYSIPAIIVNASADGKKMTSIGFKFPRISDDFKTILDDHVKKFCLHSN